MGDSMTDTISMEQKILSGVESKGIALMTHLVVGFPSIEVNKELLQQMDDAGVELVEFQFPFSEPVADGPLFARANQESIESGTTIDDCFELMAWASKKFSFKILMMGYYNTVFKRGEEKFVSDLVKAGGTGMIVPDLPLEEASNLLEVCEKNNVEFIHLLTPTTTDTRLKVLAAEINKSNAFTYAVARKGTTGQHTDFSAEVAEYVKTLKAEVKKPIGVGFGIGSKADVDQLRGVAEMAIIGSRVLRLVEEEGVQSVGPFLKSLR